MSLPPDKPEAPRPDEPDDTDRPADDADRERRGDEPIMEAPGADTGTTPEAASWNPAQGDRSFGYGAGSTGSRAAADGSRTVDEDGAR